MKYKQNLKATQTQKQKMTPSLIQSIQMLGLSAYDVYETVVRELSENPVLETSTEDWGKNSISEILERTVAEERTLSTHLMEQAHYISRDDEEYNLLEYLISSLDENGFLSITPEDVSRELKVEFGEVERALKTLNGFDPAGCGTAGSRESLVVQAEEHYPGDPLLKEILEHYLEELGRGEYGKISRYLEISKETVQEKKELIRKLEPFPGKNFSPSRKEYIIPDLYARIEKGNLIITLNESSVPEIRINPLYSEIMTGRTGGDEKNYLMEKIEAAKNLISTLNKRRETLIQVAEEILTHQKNFILKGPGNLLPLLQKDIAERTGLHESTISRIVNRKYVDISGRILPLKVFFARGVSTDGSGAGRISTDQIRNKISEIVDSEDKTKPFKDDEIVRELRKSGYYISRRTVAKYRGILRIETAGRRKRKSGIKIPFV
jgi:RNA polymerase sigma-54 factor